MQTQQQPTTLDSFYQDLSHLNRSAVPSTANPLAIPIIYTEHRAHATTDAAFERCAGRAMQSLSLPPPTSLPSTPFGRRQEPGSSLVKFAPQFSPGRPEQHSYPSPPMSDSHSPARRSAQIVEPEGHPYPPPLSDARRGVDGIAPLPPPPPPPPPSSHPQSSSSLLDHRTAASSHHRTLYPGESQPRTQPLHYRPGRAIEPPYGGMQVAPNYAYGYPPAGVASYLGGGQNPSPGPQVQPTAIIAPQPLRQNKPARRTKAHVASACVNCKKAHLSCDVQRPCGRCVASGKQDTCKDVQHKKRGRPRLRDDKEFGRTDEARTAPAQILGALPASGPETFIQRSPYAATRALGPTREEDISTLRHHSTTGTTTTGGPPPPPPPPPPRVVGSSYGGAAAASPYAAGPDLAYQSLPVAFLNLDLVIQKSNQAFQDLTSFLGDIREKSLADLLESRQADFLQRVRNELREERDEREPAYMAPITPIGQDPMQSVMQSVSERDVDQVSQGYTERSCTLNFRLPNGQSQAFQALIRLAKTSLYFVTLVVHTTRPAGPPLLTQQLAPPTPIHASQTKSAPTTAPTKEFGSYPVRPSSSASSAPTSPYFNFSSVRTSLPTISSSSYGSSPSYGYSSSAGPEQGYFPTYQPPSQPGAYPSPYQPVSRTGSVASEPQSEGNRPARLEGLQLPPIRTAPAPLLASPLGQEFGESSRERERVRRRESPTSADPRPDTPDTGKRRRLNIHEVLE